MSDDLLSLYDYDLPPELIAQRPAGKRDESRLLLLAGDGKSAHRSFRELPEILCPGDLLVRNNTRVIPARLRGKRPGGGKTELLLIHRLEGDERWLCLARPTSHLKPGKQIFFGEGRLVATVEERLGEGKVTVSFGTMDAGGFMEQLESLGEVPLPPYISRGEDKPDTSDRDRYQTIYASENGAVAAPTAGLHFTPEIDAALAARGVACAYLTLHVGPGTFRPIKTERLSEHRMDEEYYIVPEETAAAVNAAKQEGRRVITVGTTSTRALESVTDESGCVHPGQGWTDCFITPGYRFRAIDGLLTNFHLPRSSLLALVSALAGRERIIEAYKEAVAEKYRFYSYGDAMLILP